MDWIIWVIVIVVIVGVIWWLLNRNSSGNTTGASTSSDSGASAPRAEQTGAGRSAGAAPAGGGAAVSAEAAATAGMASAAGFGSPAGRAAPTTADDARERPQEPVTAEAGPSTPRPTSQGTRAAEPAAPAASAPASSAPASSAPASSAPAGGDVDDWDEDSTAAREAPTAKTDRTATQDATAEADRAAVADKSEWEAQWSEAASTPHAVDTHPRETAAKEPAARETPADGGKQSPVHHPEYTEPHAPTLPGAESAAAEDVATDDVATDDVAADEGAAELPPARGAGPGAGTHAGVLSEGDAETLQAAASSAATEAAASHTAEPAGHLAADKPYGEGSAAPGPDGSGPEGYTVKGNAESMIYHDETSPDYEETTAEVWFESAAHAEAAGFRAPRRSRH